DYRAPDPVRGDHHDLPDRRRSARLSGAVIPGSLVACAPGMTRGRTYRLICAFSVSTTTRSNDDAFGGALVRWSATYLSRFATRLASFSLSALRWLICLLTSSTRCSGFIARRLSGRSSSLMREKLLRPAVTSVTRSPSPVTASEVA